MQNTINHGMNKPEYNNVVDVNMINFNTDIIDKGLTLNVGDSTGTGNNYILDIGSITLTADNKGIAFRFWADKDSTGAVKINTDYNLLKGVGKPVSNLKAGNPYTVVYDGGSNFFLGSGSSVDGDKVTATEKDVLAPKTFIGSDEEIHTGSMPELGTVTKQLGINETFSLGEGHIKGLKVTQNITSLTGHQYATETAYWPINTGGNTQPQIFLRPPRPAYLHDDVWIRQAVPYLQPQYIVSGANILGCAGSATIESLGGARYSSGTKAGGADHTVSCPFEPDLVVMYSYYGANASNYISIVAKNGFMGTSYKYLMFTYDVDSPGKIEGVLPSYYGYNNGVLTLPILDTNTKFTHKYIAFKF